MKAFALVAAIALPLIALAGRGVAQTRPLPARALRGFTLSIDLADTHFAPADERDKLRAMLEELRRLGANWVALTPFGWLDGIHGTLIDAGSSEVQRVVATRLALLVDEAHAAGFSVMVVPHLRVRSDVWRGELDPGSPARWQKFLASYARWIRNLAQQAQQTHADAFSIGLECKSFSGRFGGHWAGVIDSVRRAFNGLVFYTANWYEEMEDVLFWDLLDAISINAYFNLTDAPSSDIDDYRAGARRAVAKVHELATLHGLPVVFTEIGYATRRDAGYMPWTWPEMFDEARIDEQAQVDAFVAMFENFIEEPWFRGAFIWRYPQSLDDPHHERPWGFSPHGRPAAQVIRDVFRSSWAGDYPGFQPR